MPANTKLKAMLGLLHEKIIMDRALTAYNAKRRGEIRDEHVAILAALEKHDGDAAEEAMRLHVRTGHAFKRKT